MPSLWVVLSYFHCKMVVSTISLLTANMHSSFFPMAHIPKVVWACPDVVFLRLSFSFHQFCLLQNCLLDKGKLETVERAWYGCPGLSYSWWLCIPLGYRDGKCHLYNPMSQWAQWAVSLLLSPFPLFLTFWCAKVAHVEHTSIPLWSEPASTQTSTLPWNFPADLDKHSYRAVSYTHLTLPTKA